MSRFLFVSLAFFGYLFCPTVVFAVSFTEVAYSFVGSDDHHEWLEILNNDQQPLDLTGWSFFDGTYHGLAPPPAKGGQGTLLIQAGNYAVLAEDASQFLADHPGFQGAVIDTVMSLPNYSANRTEPVSLGLRDKAKQDVAKISYLPTERGNNGYTWEFQADSHWGNSTIVGGSPGAPAPPPPIINYPNIQLSEIMVNPAGKDVGNEWLELYNPTDQAVDLVGCQLTDQRVSAGSADNLSLPSGSIIDSRQYWLFRPKTGFFGNKEQTLTLNWPDGQRLATLSIPLNTTEDMSYAQVDGLWQWTNQPTPGQTNLTSRALPTPSPSPPRPISSIGPQSTLNTAISPVSAPSLLVSPNPSPRPSPKAQSAVTGQKKPATKPSPSPVLPVQISPIAIGKVAGEQTTTAKRLPGNALLLMIAGLSNLLVISLWQWKNIQRIKRKIIATIHRQLII